MDQLQSPGDLVAMRPRNRESEATQIQVLQDNALIFEGGDVVIDMGGGRDGIMVVHSSVLKKHSDWFAAILSGRWADTKEVWEMNMYLDHDTQLSLLKLKSTAIKTGRVPPVISRFDHQDQSRVSVVLEQWKQCNTDEKLKQHLESNVTPAQMAQIPKLQVHADDVQPLESRLACYTLEELKEDDEDGEDDEKIVFGQEYHSYCTYMPFLHAYGKWMPLLAKDAQREYDMQYSWKPAHNKIPTAKNTVRYLRIVWKTLLALLYGKHISNTYTTRILDRVRLAANVATLAEYLGCLEVISPGLEQLITRSSGIWEFVAENPQCCLMLGYLIRSVHIYIDAAKHVVGRTLFPNVHAHKLNRFPLQPLELFFDRGCDFFKPFVPPPEVTSFLLEVRSNMTFAAMSFQQRLLSAISENVWNGLVGGPKNVLRMAELLLKDYISGACNSQICGWKFELCKTLPQRWTALYTVLRHGESDDLIQELGLDNLLESKGLMSSKRVADVIMQIVSTDRMPTVLMDCCAGLCPMTCKSCYEGRSLVARYGNSVGDQGALTLCAEHSHKARYNNGNVFTALHEWGMMAGSHKVEGEAAWPPPSAEWRPNQSREPLPAIPTQTITYSTLKELGLAEMFLVPVDGDAKLKHHARRTNSTKFSQATEDVGAAIEVLQEGITWPGDISGPSRPSGWSFGCLDTMD